jgi:hypothetical protein
VCKKPRWVFLFLNWFMNSKTFDKMKEEIIRQRQQEQDKEAQEERVKALCEIVKYMDANYTLS